MASTAAKPRSAHPANAVAGYPDISVPAGYAQGELPLGVSFFGARWNESRLIAYVYAFEQATHVRRPPKFLPTLGGASPSRAPAVAGRVGGHAY